MITRSGVFVSGRNKSTRLPNKLFLPLGETTTLGFLLDRLKTAKEPDLFLITTSIHPDDTVFQDVADRHGFGCFFGDEDDKLTRYRDAMEAHDLDYGIVVDADDTLVDGSLVDRIIAANRTTTADFSIINGLPLGLTGFGVSRSGLDHVLSRIDHKDTEIWGQYFTEDPGCHCLMLAAAADENRPDYRLTLDYEADYRLIRELAETLSASRPNFTSTDICAWLDAHPKQAAVNASAHADWQARTAEQIKKQAVTPGSIK